MGNKTFSFEILEIRRAGAKEREEDKDVNQWVRDRDTGLALQPRTSAASTQG